MTTTAAVLPSPLSTAGTRTSRLHTRNQSRCWLLRAGADIGGSAASEIAEARSEGTGQELAGEFKIGQDLQALAVVALSRRSPRLVGIFGFARPRDRRSRIRGGAPARGGS